MSMRQVPLCHGAAVLAGPVRRLQGDRPGEVRLRQVGGADEDGAGQGPPSDHHHSPQEPRRRRRWKLGGGR